MTDRRDGKVAARNESREGDLPDADEMEAYDMRPPKINRSGGLEDASATGAGEEDSVSEWEKSLQKRFRAAEEEQERMHEEVVQQWIDHMGRCLNDENPSGENVVTWMDMVETEMSKTEFLNLSGFVTNEKNDFAGILDDEMKKFIMYFGEGDNSKALDFVIEMKKAVLKKMADIELALEEEDECEIVFDQEDGDSARVSSATGVTPDNDTSKTQGQVSPAASMTANEVVNRPVGQVTL